VPLTFPTHPVAVLPLKLWRPRWFDGTGLVFGSMAPDFGYAFDGSGLPVWPLSHEIVGLAGWCLPVAWVCTWMMRRAAPVIAVHLPRAGVLRLRDYGSAAAARHRWWTTVISILIGAASHLALDRLEFWVPVAEDVMTLLGVIGIVVLVVAVGRRRLLRRWYGDPPVVRPSPLLFWSVAAVVALPVIAALPFLPGASLAHTTGARLLCAVFAGLIVAAVVVGARRRSSDPRSVRGAAACPRAT
jgi:hypothetical protein